jgi:maleate isomerase
MLNKAACQNVPHESDDHKNIKRIGLVVLNTDETIEPAINEIIRMPEAVVLVNRIIFAGEINQKTLMGLGEDLERCVSEILPDQDLDVVIFGCSSGTVAIGEAEVARKIANFKSQARVTNPMTAAIAAMRALKASSISILTPYPTNVTETIRDFYEEKGISVLSLGTFGTSHDYEIPCISRESIIRGARSICQEGTEAVFLSCTALRASAIAQEIEDELGIPVITSNQAIAWHALRLCGHDEAIHGFGRLLRLPLTG